VKVEILFHTSSTPKVFENAYAVYTKDALLCVQLDDGMICKYPLLNVFSVCHMHGQHAGTTFHPEEKQPAAGAAEAPSEAVCLHGADDQMYRGQTIRHWCVRCGALCLEDGQWRMRVP
jgi:hypothetical protein